MTISPSSSPTLVAHSNIPVSEPLDEKQRLEQLDTVFQQIDQPNYKNERYKEVRNKICELSTHPLRKLVGKWIKSSYYQLSTSKMVELVKHFLASPSERIQAIVDDPKFNRLRGEVKWEGAYLLLANEELFQYKNEILDFFGAVTYMSSNLGVDHWAHRVFYHTTLPVSFSKILEWHKRLVTTDFLPDQSLALFNKLCWAVGEGNHEISEELMTFLLSFDPLTRLGVVSVLFRKERKHPDFLKKLPSIIPRDTHPKVASEIIEVLNSCSEQEFEEALQLVGYCETDANCASVFEELCRISNKKACLALFETLSSKKISSKHMHELLRRLAYFTNEERTIYFKAIEKLVLNEGDAEVISVKQLINSTDPKLLEVHAFHVACLFLTCPELLDDKESVVTFFDSILESSESCTKGWTERVFYNPALSVSFSQILQWHQRLATSDLSPQQSLALFNKLCWAVNQGRTEISEKLFDFLLDFSPYSRLGAIEVLFLEEDVVEKCRTLFSCNAHPMAIIGIIQYLKKWRPEGFQEIVQLTSFCQSDEGYCSVLKRFYELSTNERREYCAFFETLSCEKIASKQMEEMLGALSKFKKKERAAYFSALAKLFFKEKSEEVQRVKQLVNPLEELNLNGHHILVEKWKQKQTSQAACLFLTNKALRKYTNEILTFFEAIVVDDGSVGEGNLDPALEKWVDRFQYSTALAVPFEQILNWHQHLVTSNFSPEQSLALFNKLCCFVEKGGREISEELFTFLLSFEPLTRLGVVDVLLTKEEERADIVEKIPLLISRDMPLSIASEIIQCLATLTKEKRQTGFHDVVLLAKFSERDKKYPQVLSHLYQFPSKERRALLAQFTKKGRVFTGKKMVRFLRLLACFIPKERDSCFHKIEKLLTEKGGINGLEEAFQRLRFQGSFSLERVINRMQEFLNDFKSDLNRVLLLQICSRESWVKEFRDTLFPLIKKESDEEKKGLLMALTFLGSEKRELLLDRFLKAEKRESWGEPRKDPRPMKLTNETLKEFFLAIPVYNRVHSLLLLCCDALDRFSKHSWIFTLRELFWWIPPKQYEAFFEFILTLDPKRPDLFLNHCLRSPFAHTIVPYFEDLFKNPLFPKDKPSLSLQILLKRHKMGIFTEHPLVTKALPFEIDERCKLHYQAYQDVLEKHRTTSPIKIEMKEVQVNNDLVRWDLDSLQKAYKPYTFADLPPNASPAAFTKMFTGTLKRFPDMGPLGLESPYPSLINLKGELQEEIRTTKFYFDTLMRHFQDNDVKERLGWCFYTIQPDVYKEYRLAASFLEDFWCSYEKKIRNPESEPELSVVGFEQALGSCYYKLPVHKRVYDADRHSNSPFILNCFKTSVQKVFYQTFVELARKLKKRKEFDTSLMIIHNQLARHVGFPHLPVYPENWEDDFPALRDPDMTEEQLLDELFTLATPLEVVKETIADSRTLIANNYWPALAEVLSVPTGDRRYLDPTGKALNEEGAIKILQKLGVIQTKPVGTQSKEDLLK